MSDKKSSGFFKNITRLSSHSGKVKNSINLYKLNVSKKSKLRIESTIRWSSSFLMLEAFKRAHNKNALLLDKPCPVTLEIYAGIAAGFSFHYLNALH